MKILKYSFSLLAAVVLFAGCEDIFGDDGKSQITIDPLPNVEQADRIAARKIDDVVEYFEYNSKGQVSKITEYRPDYPENGDWRIRETVYSYQGLLVKSNRSTYYYRKVSQNNEYNWLVESAGEGTYVKEEVKEDARRTEGVLNAAGRLTSNKVYVMESDWMNDGYKEILSVETTYTYAADGNIAGSIENDLRNGDLYSYSLEWENGNVQYVEYGVDRKFNFTYRDEEYKWPGINLYWDFDCEDYYGDMDITGLDGKKFKNLLDRVSATNPETGETAYCEMVYTFDSKGRVKTMNYRFNDSDGVYEDEEDAVKFYYGDETLPQVSLPVYLVGQEPVKAELKPHQVEVGTVSGESNLFDLWKWVKNVYSDGRETTYKYVTPSSLWLYSQDPTYFKEITREELSQIRSMDNLVEHLSLAPQDDGERYATYTIDIPVYGEISMSVMLGDHHNPQSVLLYNPQQIAPGMWGQTSHYFDVFTHQYLSSLFRWQWDLDKRTEVENMDGSKTEIWDLKIRVKYNLWTDVLPGCEDTVSEVLVELWVE